MLNDIETKDQHETQIEQRSKSYMSLDQTAIAFAENHYFYTYSTGKECGANLYSETISGRTLYFYDDFRYGNEHSVSLPLPSEPWKIGNRTYVGNIHSHPRGHKYQNRFSGYDISAFHSLLNIKPEGFIFEAYLVTQEEKVLKYDPKTDTEIVASKFLM